EHRVTADNLDAVNPSGLRDDHRQNDDALDSCLSRQRRIYGNRSDQDLGRYEPAANPHCRRVIVCRWLGWRLWRSGNDINGYRDIDAEWPFEGRADGIQLVI